jgi:hypothetical protein
MPWWGWLLIAWLVISLPAALLIVRIANFTPREGP